MTTSLWGTWRRTRRACTIQLGLTGMFMWVTGTQDVAHTNDKHTVHCFSSLNGKCTTQALRMSVLVGTDLQQSQQTGLKMERVSGVPIPRLSQGTQRSSSRTSLMGPHQRPSCHQCGSPARAHKFSGTQPCTLSSVGHGTRHTDRRTAQPSTTAALSDCI